MTYGRNYSTLCNLLHIPSVLVLNEWFIAVFLVVLALSSHTCYKFLSLHSASIVLGIPSRYSLLHNPATFLATNPSRRQAMINVITVVVIPGNAKDGAVMKMPFTISNTMNKTSP